MYPVVFNRIPEKWYPGRFNIWVSLVVQCMAHTHTDKLTDMSYSFQVIKFSTFSLFLRQFHTTLESLEPSSSGMLIQGCVQFTKVARDILSCMIYRALNYDRLFIYVCTSSDL
jgi:hypothetical protein